MKIGGRRNFIVDIGSTKTRVIDLEFIGGKTSLTYYNELDYSGISSEELENFLRTEGKAFFNQIPGKSFYVSIPGRGILIRSISVPKVPIKKLKDILKYEVQQQIPFPLEVVTWKYQIFEETAQNYNILFGAIKREILGDYISRVTWMGIDPIFLDTDPFALLNLFVFFKNPGRERCLGLLEIGANSSNLIIMHREKFLIRSLTISGNAITTTISETENVSFQEAENIKKEKGMENKAVISTVDNLNTELQNSIDYWRFTQKGPELEELYICGGTSYLKGLKEYLAEKGRIPVNYFQPLEEIEVSSEYTFLKEKQMELATVVGIGLRKILPVFININLLPEEIERLREFRINRPYIYLSIVMAGLISITPVWFYNQDKLLLKGILDELDVSLKQYEKYKPEIEKLEKEISEINSKMGIVKGLVNKKNMWLKRIISIGNVLPSSRIYIVSIVPGVAQAPQPTTPLVTQLEQPPAPAGPMPPPGPPVPPEGPPVPPEGPPVPPEGPEQPVPAAPAEVKIESGNVFTINGEVVIGDIRTAFNDFKDFVDQLSKVDFIQKVEISSCEVNEGKGKIEFSIVITLK